MTYELPFASQPLMQQKIVNRAAIFTNADVPINIASPLQKWDVLVSIMFFVEARLTGAGTRSLNARYLIDSITRSEVDFIDILTTSFTRYEQRNAFDAFAIGVNTHTSELNEIQIRSAAGAATFEAQNASVVLIYIPYQIGSDAE